MSEAPEKIWLSAPDIDNEHDVWFDPSEGGTAYVLASEIDRLQRENAELRERGQAFANQVRHITYLLNGQAYSTTVSELNAFDAALRRPA